MGTKDSKAKEYLSDNTRFSEICNYVLFDGEKVIKPENLKECDTTEVLSVFGIDKKQIVAQRGQFVIKFLILILSSHLIFSPISFPNSTQ